MPLLQGSRASAWSACWLAEFQCQSRACRCVPAQRAVSCYSSWSWRGLPQTLQFVAHGFRSGTYDEPSFSGWTQVGFAMPERAQLLSPIVAAIGRICDIGTWHCPHSLNCINNKEQNTNAPGDRQRLSRTSREWLLRLLAGGCRSQRVFPGISHIRTSLCIPSERATIVLV